MPFSKAFFVKRILNLSLTQISVVFSYFICLAPDFAHAQVQEKNLSNTHIILDVSNIPLNKVLSKIEEQTTFRFAYNTDLVLRQKNITINVRDIELNELLHLLFTDTHLSYNVSGNQVILQKTDLPEKITISGYVKDAQSGESLAGSSLYLPSNKEGTFSSQYGFYSVTVPPSDSLELMISYVGYQSILKKINCNRNVFININMEKNKESASSVIIATDKMEDNVKKNQFGAIDISSDMLVNIASISGEGDIISSVQMLAGVQAGLDGTPGYFVRGGSAGQNQVLLDEATLYNPSHLFGLVSIFNASAIKNASLLKGGFPASYGDYLSSILDVTMKDGNNQQFGGIIQAGTIASGVTLYGPLKPGKGSFLISARRSTIDLLLRPFSVQNYFSNYYFYDINAKINYQLSQKDRIFLSFYKGRDNNSYTTDISDSSVINYSTLFGNQALTLRWNHLYSGELFSNSSLIYSNYQQSLSAIRESYFAQLYSGIRDINFKVDFYYYPNVANKIRWGANYLYQSLLPATISDKISLSGTAPNIRPGDIPEKNSNRVAIFLSDAIKLNKKSEAYIGIRSPVFFNANVLYYNIEPRLSLLYLIKPSVSIKVFYAQTHQFIHLVQSYNASFPAEIWIGSSKIVQPQASQQVTVGLFKNFKENIIQTSLEFYYKSMEHQLLFKGSTQQTIYNNIEDRLIFGEARSYGTEFFIRKTRGKFTGWLAYSLAYAFQQFDSLNFGKSFPFAYDRRHSVHIATTYSINQHWKVSTNFFIASGRAFTLNTNTSPGSTNQDSNPLFDDENNNNGNPNGNSQDIEPNNYRLTPYDRLDVSIEYKKNRKIGKKNFEFEWVFSVYNVYGRHNTSLAYRAIDPVTKQAIAKQISFIPIIPSVTYSLKF